MSEQRWEDADFYFAGRASSLLRSPLTVAVSDARRYGGEEEAARVVGEAVLDLSTFDLRPGLAVAISNAHLGGSSEGTVGLTLTWHPHVSDTWQSNLCPPFCVAATRLA